MRLNSIMIYYQLSKRFKINHAQYSQQYSVGRPVFYEPSVYTEGRAVIVDAENALHCVRHLTGCVLLLAGYPNGSFDCGGNDAVFLDAGISLIPGTKSSAG